jgi:two-component system nitrate/nitrite response regulator NarL
MNESVVAREGTKPVSVLTVDDQLVFRQVAREVVEETDGFHSAAEAVSGEEALRLAEACWPDLVLIDVRMPDMHGLEAAARMKRSCPTAVIVLISADADAVAPHSLDQCGAADFVLKKEFGPAALRALWAKHATTAART